MKSNHPDIAVEVFSQVTAIQRSPLIKIIIGKAFYSKNEKDHKYYHYDNYNFAPLCKLSRKKFCSISFPYEYSLVPVILIIIGNRYLRISCNFKFIYRTYKKFDKNILNENYPYHSDNFNNNIF